MIVQINRPKLVGATVATISSKAVKQGGSAAQAQPIICRRYHIQTPKTIWTVTHNQNTDRFMVVLRDEQGEQFDAKVVRVNSKTIEVHLATALSGYVDLIFDVSTNPVIAV